MRFFRCPHRSGKWKNSTKGDISLDTVTLEPSRALTSSYVDGNEYVFADKEDYTPYTFTKDQIEEELLFMPAGGMPDMQVLTSIWPTAGALVSFRRPWIWKSSKPRRVLKRASASARTKLRDIKHRSAIQVPYLERR